MKLFFTRLVLFVLAVLAGMGAYSYIPAIIDFSPVIVSGRVTDTLLEKHRHRSRRGGSYTSYQALIKIAGYPNWFIAPYVIGGPSESDIVRKAQGGIVRMEVPQAEMAAIKENPDHHAYTMSLELNQVMLVDSFQYRMECMAIFLICLGIGGTCLYVALHVKPEDLLDEHELAAEKNDWIQQSITKIEHSGKHTKL